MPRYSTHKKLIEKLDVGSLNSRIRIQTRAIKMQPNSPNYTEQFADFVPTAKLWACIESISGVSIFDGANIEREITHLFYVRFIPLTTITFMEWINYETNYYRIYKVEDLQNEHKFYKIYTGIVGNDAKPVNWA